MVGSFHGKSQSKMERYPQIIIHSRLGFSMKSTIQRAMGVLWTIRGFTGSTTWHQTSKRTPFHTWHTHPSSLRAAASHGTAGESKSSMTCMALSVSRSMESHSLVFIVDLLFSFVFRLWLADEDSTYHIRL